MNFTIIEKIEEPLLSRIHVIAEVSFDKATPSTAEITKQIASALKKDEKLVVMKKIATDYGSRHADIDAVVYDSEKALEYVEVKPKKQREAEKKAAEDAAKKATEEKTAAEAPKEEAPAAEEKKEEAPAAEEKKEEAKPAEEKKEKAPTAEEKKAE